MTDIPAASVAVAIPVYRPEIDGLELFSLQYSLRNLNPEREIFFVCPKSLDVSFYRRLAPSAKFATFDDGYFTSIASYCRLLLNPHFYERFSAYEFILLTQPDAIIIKDELDYWCAQEYDYIGAPWHPVRPIPVSAGGRNKLLRIGVGNGGFSLRRVKKCVELLTKFSEIANGPTLVEDMFFSIYGFISDGFSIPDRFTASRFALECAPAYFFELNTNYLPMGAHAWWKLDLDFWLNTLHSDIEPVRDLALQGFAESQIEQEKRKQLWMDGLKAKMVEHINKIFDDLEEKERQGRPV
ncbi:MAG: hypothetical protein LBC63_09835 [Holophagales bacterium]|jgi:hypothetical protein|nr:hypothetical protein [Holophagales bacterium]